MRATCRNRCSARSIGRDVPVARTRKKPDTTAWNSARPLVNWTPYAPGFYLITFVNISVIGVVAAGLATGRWGGAAVGAVAGIASFTVGGFLGFLFGIPRYASDPAVSGQDDKYSANTNLEQISDWLTKIIVGAGLTQFRAIGGWVSDVARRLATGLVHGRPTGNEEALAMGLLLLTAICGFLFFYLWSRVYLPQIPWVRVSSVPAPAQGWKLHVSPWRSNGLEVLDRCVPVLLAEGASFKVCSTLAGLAKMTRPWRRSTGHRDRSCSWRSISSSSGRSWSSVAWTATRRRRTARAHATGYVMRRRCSVDWLTRV